MPPIFTYSVGCGRILGGRHRIVFLFQITDRSLGPVLTRHLSIYGCLNIVALLEMSTRTGLHDSAVGLFSFLSQFVNFQCKLIDQFSREQNVTSKSKITSCTLVVFTIY